MTLLVDEAKGSPYLLKSEERLTSLRIPGCVSQAWLTGELKEGLCQFRCGADSPLVEGLLVFLCRFYSGCSPTELASGQQDPLKALRLLDFLSPTRRNGLEQARNRIRALATEMQEL